MPTPPVSIPHPQSTGPSHSPPTRKPVPHHSPLSDEEQEQQDSMRIDAMFSHANDPSTSSMPITSESEFAVFHFNDPQPELEELDEEGIPMADFERHAPSLHPPSYITVFGHDREFDPPARAEDLTVPEPNNAGSLEGSETTTRELAKQSRVRRCGKWCLDYAKGHYGLWIFFIVMIAFIVAMIILGRKGLL
jgi:hypothetical protein